MVKIYAPASIGNVSVGFDVGLQLVERLTADAAVTAVFEEQHRSFARLS